MENNSSTNRAVLLDLVNGGNGRPGPWIEKATLRRPGQEDAAIYALHLQNPNPHGRDLVIVAHDGNLELCHDILLMLETGAQPRDPEVTAEEAARDLEARRAALPQPEDCGRIVAAPAELEK